jgi:arsenite methyltransferase
MDMLDAMQRRSAQVAEVLELRSQPPNEQLTSTSTAAPGHNDLASTCQSAPASLFDRCWRQYALCREHLFTDHTHHIASALQPMLSGRQPRYLVEAGCGPGFYSRRLAARFPQLQITGIDLCEPLLYRARDRAHRSGLRNCRFLKADALSLADFPNQADAVIASRLFLILADPALALDAIYTTLRPGGICFIAEPTSLLSAALPMWLMKMTGYLGPKPEIAERHPVTRVFSIGDFEGLVATKPWQSTRIWTDRKYHCAVCTKGA